MEKIKKVYKELSSDEYGTAYSIGWLLLSSCLIVVLVFAVLWIVGGGGPLKDAIEMLLSAPLLSLCIVFGRLIFKVLRKFFDFFDTPLLKLIVYGVALLALFPLLGTTLVQLADKLPESQIVQYLMFIGFDAVYAGIIFLLYRTKKKYVIEDSNTQDIADNATNAIEN